MQAPRQRTAEEERARAAARQAEKELWERTRGAGSAVFKLADGGTIRRRRRSLQAAPQPPQSKRHQLLLQHPHQHNGAASSDAAPSRRGLDSSTNGLEALSLAQPSSSREGLSTRREGSQSPKELLPWTVQDVLPSLEEVETKRYEPVEVPSADVLLSRGICEYTLLPKVLGRGKFSTVFMAGKNDEQWAIKHTALFPHHQLIATRLLREPTLLAELPPHPNLVVVKETIRTPGHFYLVEEYLEDYVTLESLIPMYSQSHPPTLPTDIANRILTQLLSAVRAIHHPLQICHRDIKPENILVHPKTLQLKLLDFGLATHFSKSEAKLSTCCGSPAYHCPEIVRSLASPPGTVTYMGPDVDAWTCGVTMLRCLIGARFPLGATHSSLRGMSIRAQRAVAGISDTVLRAKVGALLEMDGKKRMQNFEALVMEQERELGEPSRGPKAFRSTTFIPTEPVHSIRLPILENGNRDDDDTPRQTPGFTTPTTSSRRSTPANSRPSSPTRYMSQPHDASNHSGQSTDFAALNPTHQPPERVISFVKYCLRCAGILYHTWADMPSSSGSTEEGGSLYHHAPAPTRGVSAAFAEAAGLPLDAASTPWTPLFPPTITATEERADGYAHVQVFQCVMEYSEEKHADTSESQGQMTFVQSIMAAFGRKLAPSLAQQQKDDQPSSQTRSASPSARAGMGKRSSSTPARSRAEAPNSNSSAGPRKDHDVRCLTFFLIVRFPKVPSSSHPTRQPLSRNSSFFGPGLFEGSPRGARSRGSSLSTALSSTLDFDVGHEPVVHEEQTLQEQAQAALPAMTKIHSSAHRHREQHKEREGRRRTVRVQEEPAIPPINTNMPVQVNESTHSPFTSPHPDRSPSASRPHSRTRKRSYLGSSSRRSQVLFHVSDERCVQAVKDALSVGGSVEAKTHSTNGTMRDRPTTPNPMQRNRSSTNLHADGHEVTVPSGLSTELADTAATPKEICLAIQERLEVIGTEASVNSPMREEDTMEEHSLETVPERQELDVSSKGQQSRLVEVASLLHHVGMVMPRIKTQRPHKFVEPFVNLVPRAIRAAVEHDAHSPYALQRAGTFDEMPGTSRARKDTSPPPTQEMMSARACDVVVACVEIARNAKKWTNAVDPTNTTTQELLVTLMLGSAIVLVPQLPKPEKSGTLAHWYFQRWKPHYAFARPADDRKAPGSPPAHFTKRSERAWTALSELQDILDIDLDKMSLERASDAKATIGSSGAAIKSMGAFMLNVGLQARERARAADVTATVWSKDEAHRRLLAAIPLITATMGTERPVTTSNSGGSSALGGGAHLPDAALTWVMWGVKDLDDVQLSDEDSTILVHTLARHAALCPDPPSRHIALDLVRTVVELHVTQSSARQLLYDLVKESPSWPLRVAILGVARGLIVKDLEQDAEEAATFASQDFLGMLSSSVYRLPADLPVAESADELRAYLEEYGQWLSECLSFVYIVTLRDKGNWTGIRKPDTLQGVSTNLVEPLQSWIAACLASASAAQDSSSPESKGSGLSTASITKGDREDIRLSLTMLSVAVERAQSAVASILQQQSESVESAPVA